MNGVLLEFAGRMADSGATQLPESYKQLIVNAQLFFKGRMSGGLGVRLSDVTDYRLTLRKGRMTLMFADGEDVSTDAQIIGTLSNDGSFMWGWGHPEVPEPMQAAAWAVQQFGDRQEIEELLTRGGPTTPERLDEYLAICAYISDANAVFVGDHGEGGKVCVALYTDNQIKKAMAE